MPKYRYKCIVDGCDRTRYQQRYCKEHYKQIRRYGKITKEKLGYPEFVYPTTINNDIVYINVNNHIVIIDISDIDIIKHKHIYIDKGGYASISINNKHKRLHRVIMNYNGYYDIDHINRNRLDNRKSNLRVCSRSENMHNSTDKLNTSTGYRGIYKVTNKQYVRDRYTARIQINKVIMNLGYFDTLEEAVAARKRVINKFNPSKL